MSAQPVFAVDEEGFSTVTFSEDDAAGLALVASRKRISALFSSCSAVFKIAGIDEACRQLNRLELDRVKLDPEYKPLKFDANEARRVYTTIMEVAQLAEYKAESKSRPYGRERTFKAAAYILELCYRQEQMPAHLVPKMEKLSPEDAKVKRKLIGALGRNWQRRFRRLHFIQCYIHLALVDKEKDPEGGQRKPRLYTDRLSDLLTETGHGAAGTGIPIARYLKSAESAVKRFRENEVNLYAPEWTPDGWVADFGAKAEEKKNQKANTAAATAALRSWIKAKQAVEEDAKAAYLLAVEKGLPIDVARQEMFDIISEVFSDEPKPTGGGDGAIPVSSVITNSDTAFSTAPESAVFASSASADFVNLLNENANSEELDRTHMSYQNLTPEGAAGAMVEACDTVGATMYKAAFTPIYPLVGMADELPDGEERSFPQKNGVNATSAELIARIPEFFRRNNEDNRNIAVRVWGPIFQVDDCSAEFYERLKPFCFAAIRTSPKSWQVWISLSGDFVGKDGKRNDALVAVRTRFFDRCKELKESANGGAYNSIRLPGTLNIKEKYAPEFPRIQLVYVSKGRKTTPEELDSAGLLVPAPTPKLVLVNPTPRPRNILAPKPFYQD